MNTLRKIQIAATVIALFVAVRLADNMQPTTNELIGSVALVIAGGVSAVSLMVNNERQPDNSK